MTSRTASCSCGQLHVTCEGEPVRTFRFCPICGSTMSGQPDLVAVAVGNFADRAFPAPRVSVYERRRHPWVAVPDHPEMQHID